MLVCVLSVRVGVLSVRVCVSVRMGVCLSVCVCLYAGPQF